MELIIFIFFCNQILYFWLSLQHLICTAGNNDANGHDAFHETENMFISPPLRFTRVT